MKKLSKPIYFDGEFLPNYYLVGISPSEFDKHFAEKQNTNVAISSMKGGLVMKSKAIFAIAILLIVLTVICIVITKPIIVTAADPIRGNELVIPRLEFSVHYERVIMPNKNAQAIIDKEDCAILMRSIRDIDNYDNIVVGDHAGQGFDIIKLLYPGDRIILTDERCVPQNYEVQYTDYCGINARSMLKFSDESNAWNLEGENLLLYCCNDFSGTSVTIVVAIPVEDE